MATIDDYIIEQFTLTDSEIPGLVKLLTSAFQEDEAAEKEGASIELLEDNFELIFGVPSIDREMFVRARHKTTNEILGFLGSIKQRLSIEGKIYTISLPCWLSVHRAHRRKGIGKAMGRKLMDMVLERNYDLAVTFHDASQKGLETSKAVSRDTGKPLELLTFMKRFIIRPLHVEDAMAVIKIPWIAKVFLKTKQGVGEIKSSRVRLYKPEDIDQICKLTADLSKRTQIGLVQECEDIKWKLSNTRVLCVVHENEQGQVDGFINGWEFLLAGFGNAVKFGWLDTVHTYNLPQKEVISLANLLSSEARKRGWKGIQSPFIPYFDDKPFRKANFVLFPKKIGMYLFNLTNITLPKKVDSIYFEWR
ncbi:MAG: GNAT family N-acetyltransferase [Asgard group archaeon]|nr:GNAT family N-acetyltransferase [Asgard group archaeon]